MSARYYVASLVLAASLSSALTGCGLELAKEYPSTAGAAAPAAAAPASAPPAPSTPSVTRVASLDSDNTDQTIFTVLGLAKRDSQRNQGPQTGNTVSPVLWQAALDTLHFAGISSEDPITGLVVTNWYSPPAKPNERLRISVFILSRALRSDSLAITVERQVQAGAGGWSDAPIARDAVSDLETAVLQRARQIHAERYRNMNYN